jgi:hypothetical protein
MEDSSAANTRADAYTYTDAHAHDYANKHASIVHGRDERPTQVSEEELIVLV